MKSNSRQTEIFDSLRAGLHVEDVDFKDTCTPAMIDREHAYWQRFLDTLDEVAGSDRATCNQLRIRRRQVLNGEHSRRDNWGLPHFVAGAAASIAVFLGAAMWWESIWSETASPTRTASIQWDSGAGGAAPGAARPAAVKPADTQHVEFADNVDFYKWLEQQSDAVADSGGG